MTRLTLAALAVGLALAPLAACGDDSASGSGATSGSTAPGATAGPAKPKTSETQPVTVTGTPLPTLGDGTDKAIGTPAPTVTGKTFDGSPVTIAPGGGKPMLVLFFAHWCPHCQREVPKVVGWLKDGSVPTGLDVVGVSTGVQPPAPNYPPSAWLTKVGWPAPVLADSTDAQAAQAYGLPAYPYFVLLKGDGTVAARATGELELDQFRKLLGSVGL
jgi:thiol-disulfide isomerase/thioredoxin